MSTYQNPLEGFVIWCHPEYRFLTVGTLLSVYAESKDERYFTHLTELENVLGVELKNDRGEVIFTASSINALESPYVAEAMEVHRAR